MKKVKITVLKKTFDSELAVQYAHETLAPCSRFAVGQTYITDCVKPDGFCDEAWTAVQPYVFALAHGATDVFYDDWLQMPGMAICSCNDGIRPVIFKVESLDK